MNDLINIFLHYNFIVIKLHLITHCLEQQATPKSKFDNCWSKEIIIYLDINKINDFICKLIPSEI